MISVSRKSAAPRPIFSRKERLPERKRMTLALGMLYLNGVIVGADTQITWSDGRTEDRRKVIAFPAATGAYAIGYSSSDAEASDTLVASIQSDIEAIDPKSLRGMELVVRDAMASWYEMYRHHSTEQRPYVQLVVGANIRRSDANPQDEVGLYACEPPSTMNRKTLDNSGGYVAIGDAKAITDPLYTTLFVGIRPPELASAHVCLSRISYLLFRAKKEFRSSVGGDTDVAVLRNGCATPQWVDLIDMRVAESFGYNMNAALATTAGSIMSEQYMDTQEVLDLASSIHTWGLTYRRAQFRIRGSGGSQGEEIS